MHIFDWVNATAFTVAGHDVKWFDLIGSVLALAVVVLATRRLMVTWPVQLVSCFLLFMANVNAHLGGNAARQAAIAAIAIYGWVNWARKREAKTGVVVRWARWPERLGMLAFLVVGTAAFALILQATHASWAPLPDAYIFIGSLVAFFGQARGWVEFWFVWVLVDVVGVPLAFMGGLYVNATSYVVFFVLCVIGIITWARQSRVTAAATIEPVSGVAAESR